MDWSYGSRGKVPALQVQSPEFKLQFHQKKKKSTPMTTMITNLDYNLSGLRNAQEPSKTHLWVCL
jgi:hypothetical protein